MARTSPPSPRRARDGGTVPGLRRRGRRLQVRQVPGDRGGVAEEKEGAEMKEIPLWIGAPTVSIIILGVGFFLISGSILLLIILDRDLRKRLERLERRQ